MYGALDIATSGMLVQRTRLEVATANVVNQNTLRDSQGRLSPFRRRLALVAAGDPTSNDPAARTLGVHVSKIALDNAPPGLREFNPDHPDAYRDGPLKGYVATTNINPVVEQINALEATRAYEANVVAAEAIKQMGAQALRLIA